MSDLTSWPTPTLSGHALCALYATGAVPVYKATIVPRGNALGMVTQLPEDDTNSLTRQEMMARMVVAMGGRAAEEKIFGYDNVTSGRTQENSDWLGFARPVFRFPKGWGSLDGNALSGLP